MGTLATSDHILVIMTGLERCYWDPAITARDAKHPAIHGTVLLAPNAHTTNNFPAQNAKVPKQRDPGSREGTEENSVI